MKYLFAILYSVLGVVFLSYLALPNVSFPDPPTDAYQSVEPADSETPLRRAYFTDFTRQEVLDHYSNEFELKVLGFEIPSYQLIYPPEDAYGLIRDQTRSTHLREIVYPFRESLYVNEFVPKAAKDDIWYKGTHYDQKITISIKQTNRFTRVFVGLVTIFVGYFLILEFWKASVSFVKKLPMLKFIIKDE